MTAARSLAAAAAAAGRLLYTTCERPDAALEPRDSQC